MKPKLHLIVLFSFLIFTNSMWSQKEANIWYFGTNAGIDFNTGTPVPLTDGQITNYEGCATIADSNGSLLFYTDGQRVWNKNHTIMPNGSDLFGHFSSAQSAVIVPKPLYPGVYYIFTVDRMGYPNGFCYSEVDMSLDSGLGDITANKNIQLLSISSEQVTGVQHSNGTDIWVVTHGFADNTFKSFLVTPAGVSTTPVVSTTGLSLSTTEITDAIGYMKISPDGGRLATCNMWSGSQICDFNNNSGIVSNALTLTTQDYDYGIEFSRSGNLLYVSNQVNNTVIQYDLQASDIPASATAIMTAQGQHGGALQIATDGKIYYISDGATYLGVINAPNALGTACNGVSEGIYLNGMHTYSIGLPNFIQSYFRENGIKAENFCLGDEVQLAIISGTPNTVVWDFGDGNSDNQVSTLHAYAVAGTYTVSATVTIGGIITVYTKDITIVAPPVAHLPADMLICDDGSGSGHLFDLHQQDAEILGTQPAAEFTVSYYLNQADAQASANALNSPYVFNGSQQTVYAKVIDNSAGCYAIVSFQLIVSPEPFIDVPDVFDICPGETVTVTAPGGFNNYQWSTGVTTQQTNISQVGTYSLIITNQAGCSAQHNFQVVSNNCITPFIPKGISPNGDNMNDEFDLTGFDVRKLDIFNRYGLEVYSRNNYTNQWHGQTDTGHDLPDGTYFYAIQKGNGEFFTGWVYVIRQNN